MKTIFIYAWMLSLLGMGIIVNTTTHLITTEVLRSDIQNNVAVYVSDHYESSDLSDPEKKEVQELVQIAYKQYPTIEWYLRLALTSLLGFIILYYGILLIVKQEILVTKLLQRAVIVVAPHVVLLATLFFLMFSWGIVLIATAADSSPPQWPQITQLLIFNNWHASLESIVIGLAVITIDIFGYLYAIKKNMLKLKTFWEKHLVWGFFLFVMIYFWAIIAPLVWMNNMDIIQVIEPQ